MPTASVHEEKVRHLRDCSRMDRQKFAEAAPSDELPVRHRSAPSNSRNECDQREIPMWRQRRTIRGMTIA